MELDYFRDGWYKMKNTQPLVYMLLAENPEEAAQKASAKNDFRFIGFAMGYEADDTMAQPIGVECPKKMETKNIIFGCAPPPTVLFKQMYRYNTELLKNPALSACKVDPRMETALKKMLDEDIENDQKAFEKSLSINKQYNN